MNIEQAVELIYTGLVSEESVPVKLRAYHELDRELLAQVQEALDFAIEYYKGEPLIPKKLAAALVDIYGAFYFNSGFSENELRELEDIGTDRFIWNRKNQQNTFKTGATGHARPADTGALQHH